jgi:hypothetical protein
MSFRAIRALVLVAQLHPVNDWRGSFGRIKPHLWYYACPAHDTDESCEKATKRRSQATAFNWPYCRHRWPMVEVQRPVGW